METFFFFVFFYPPLIVFFLFVFFCKDWKATFRCRVSQEDCWYTGTIDRKAAVRWSVESCYIPRSLWFILCFDDTGFSHFSSNFLDEMRKQSDHWNATPQTVQILPFENPKFSVRTETQPDVRPLVWCLRIIWIFNISDLFFPVVWQDLHPSMRSSRFLVGSRSFNRPPKTTLAIVQKFIIFEKVGGNFCFFSFYFCQPFIVFFLQRLKETFRCRVSQGDSW